MEQQPIKVLVVAGRMHYGGLETMIMNFYRHLDKNKVIFDFLLNYEQPGAYDDEIRALGGKIYIIPRLEFKNLFRYIKSLKSFFKAHNEYSVLHGHLTSVGIIYLPLAKRYGIKKRIVHAHYTSVPSNFKGFIERMMLLPLRFCSDWYFACSNAAGKFCYGKNILKKSNYKLIKNGVVVDKFLFNASVRDEYRKNLKLEDKFVIGHIGRFEEQKNHDFLIDIFSELSKKDSSAVLMLVGNGSLMIDIQKKVKSLGLTDKIIFLENRNDVNNLMQCMDVFLLPSLYEGLPVVGVEAQTAGLSCVFADTITPETDITGLCKFISLKTSPSVWADEILDFKNAKRKNTKELISKAGYDIAQQTKELEEFYLK